MAVWQGIPAEKPGRRSPFKSDTCTPLSNDTHYQFFLVTPKTWRLIRSQRISIALAITTASKRLLVRTTSFLRVLAPGPWLWQLNQRVS
jgi:hypothetical protein